jgi:hypothetical protein
LNSRIIAALAVPTLTMGAAVLVASPATAHTPNISADCGGVHVRATAYDAGLANHWSVTIDGVTQSGTFGASVDQTFPVPQNGTTTPWSAFVEAADGSYHGSDSGTVGPCGTPPADACADLPGPQPTGTPCTPPPDVQRTAHQALDGCKVTLQGTAYGAGALTYDAAYTDTYVFDQPTDSWHLVTDTNPTVSDLHFTPWTIQAQVGHGCLAKPHQPAAVHTTHSQTHENCSHDVAVTTTWTLTTPYVYNEATNTWVLGQPVKHKTRHEVPMKPGACNDTAAPTAHPAVAAVGAAVGAAVQASAPGSTAPSSATLVPTVVEAGLTAAPAQASTVASAASPAARSQEPRMPALLLLSGLLLLLGGALRFRRN